MIHIIFMCVFLALTFTLAFIVNESEQIVKEPEVDDIDIEAMIQRHGVIVPNHWDFERDILEESWFAEGVKPPKNDMWRKLEPISPGHIHSRIQVRAWGKERGDRYGRTPRGKTLHDKRRESRALLMADRDSEY